MYGIHEKKLSVRRAEKLVSPYQSADDANTVYDNEGGGRRLTSESREFGFLPPPVIFVFIVYGEGKIAFATCPGIIKNRVSVSPVQSTRLIVDCPLVW